MLWSPPSLGGLDGATVGNAHIAPVGARGAEHGRVEAGAGVRVVQPRRRRHGYSFLVFDLLCQYRSVAGQESKRD